MTSIADRLAREKDKEEGIGTNQQAVKYLDQDYEFLKQTSLRRGLLFEDNKFPASQKSLGYNELGPYSSKTRDVVWKRPTELCSDPKFIDDGATRTDICQGALGDCWLLAAIASLTLDQRILARVVPPGQSFTEDYAGIFHFQFWQYGEWVDVVIDDRLPTKDGKLLFVHSAEGSEFWSALLEKAYAKLNGSYEALAGGSTIEGFEDFTGGIGEIYELNNAPQHLFQIMQKALKLGSLMGCSIDITSAYESEAITSHKLVKGHAYSVTGAEEVNYRGRKVQLIRVRNPWGQVEWTGAWSDGSNEWSHISEDEKTKLNHISDDGEFWMSYLDFTRHFSKLEICNLTPDTLESEGEGHWKHYQFEGMWRVGSTAGGCRNHPATFTSNPQFVVRLDEVDDDPLDGQEKGCTFLVGLMQKDVRKQRQLNKDLEIIGFAIYEYKGSRHVHLGPDVLLRENAVAMSHTFINTREICDRFTLAPGEYAIIPSTFQPHRNGKFVLRVFSEKQLFVNVIILITNINSTFLLFQGSDIKTDGFSLETGRIIVSLLDKDESSKLGLLEFHKLWLKIQRYLVNSAVLQVIVSRYADAQFAIDFDSFVGCLIKLEMLFKMFKALDKSESGKIELDIQQVCSLKTLHCLLPLCQLAKHVTFMNVLVC
uniref:Calpain catalytic domain-containing protein n=1 Tax=Periophthalmus magnuspinnatus TaxID=409849 RepID=A0A3B4BD48_9GOBI